ncbi:PHD finger protein 7-like, partial [Pezoporus occidentalis]|uniref:PHD finger protein 7-like n=1 Tax=Pezoporus occidentalis TaxID=407982 RepID=UPI002F908646
HLASELHREDTEQEGEMRFSRTDIQRTVEQAAQMDCFVCGERGATITCQEVGCDRRFHLPCAVEGECVTLYLPPFRYLLSPPHRHQGMTQRFSSHPSLPSSPRSFCQEHRPQQQDLVAPEGTVCLIFPQGLRRASLALFMFLLQEQAMHSGILCLQCPLCRNRYEFLLEMINMGIQIPLSCTAGLRTGSLSQQGLEAEGMKRRALLGNPVLWALHPQRHEPISFPRPWQLFLCCSCAAEGTHRCCSNLGNSPEARWECDSCAGLGTCKCQSTWVLLGWGQGPGKAWQWVPGVGLAESVCSRRAGAPLRPTLPQAWEPSP